MVNRPYILNRSRPLIVGSFPGSPHFFPMICDSHWDSIVSFLLFQDPIFNCVLSHNNPCFQCNIAIANCLLSHTCEIRFNDALCRCIPTQKNSKTWLTYMAKWVFLEPYFSNLIRWIHLCDKKNPKFVDCCDKIKLNLS